MPSKKRRHSVTGNKILEGFQLTMVPFLLLLLDFYSTALVWLPPLSAILLGVVPSLMPSLQSCPCSGTPPALASLFFLFLSFGITLFLYCSSCPGILLVSPLPLLRCPSCPHIVSHLLHFFCLETTTLSYIFFWRGATNFPNWFRSGAEWVHWGGRCVWPRTVPNLHT